MSPELPDPAFPFWWFSTERVNSKIPAGRAVRAKAGSRLHPLADYWCHEGAAEWVKVMRDPTQQRPTKKRARDQRRAA